MSKAPISYTLTLLEKILDRLYEIREPALFIGKPGIGKSQKIYSWAQKKAQELGRQLMVWHELPKEAKEQIARDPSRYFILVDLKLQSVGSPEKIVGIPVIVNGSNEAKIVWEPPLFVKALSHPNAAGVLFLDEINMAAASLQSLAFEIVLQKKVGEYKLSDNVIVIAAGNDLESNIAANPVPKPLLNRLLVLRVEPSVDEWIVWAVNAGLDERIIAFVKLFRDVYRDVEEELQQITTPRSFEKLSKAIKNIDDVDLIEIFARGYLNEVDAVKFINFVKNLIAINYRELVRDFRKFKELDIEKKYAAVTLIAKHHSEFTIEELAGFVDKLIDDTIELAPLLLSFVKNNVKCKSSNEKTCEEEKKSIVREITKRLPPQKLVRIKDLLL